MLFETACRHRVGEDKKVPLIPELFIEPFPQQFVFMIEHRSQPNTADVTICRAVDSIAKGHVVGRHRLGDCPGGASNLEKSAGYLLSGTNLRKRAVFFCV